MAITKHIDKSVDTEFTGREEIESCKSWGNIDRLPGLSAAPSGQIPHPEPSKKPGKLEESE